MKRFFSLLLCLCLLLGGCVTTAEPTEMQKPPADVSVQTNYSQYAPREALLPKYIPAAEPCYDLVASDSYGAIYPYAGLSTSTEFSGSRFQYGMVDARGQILTEPVYSQVELLWHWDDYTGFSQSHPYWILEKQIVDEDYNYTFLYAVANQDGSVVTECSYSAISWGDGYILAVDTAGEQPRFDIFDSEMQLYLRSEDIPALEQIPKNYLNYFSAELSDGMFLFYCTDESGQSLYYFTDLQGETLLGPYSYAEQFIDGIALVQDSYDTYGYINKSGEPCFPYSFTYCSGFREGVAVVGDVNGTRSLVDREGNVILREGEWQTLYRTQDIYGLQEEGIVNYYNARGELIYEDIPYNWDYLGHGIFSDWENELIVGATQKRFTVSREEDSYHYPNPLWDYGFDYITVEDFTDQTVTYLLNEELELLEKVEGTMNLLTSSEKAILYAQEGQSMRFYDRELQPLFSCTLPFDGYLRTCLYEDRVMIFCERYCLHYSLSGELLFCYLLPGYGGD